MNLCTRIVFISLWLLNTVYTDAQTPPGFSLPFTNNVMQNGIVPMPVTVTNFSKIVSMQFVIRWDPKVAKYVALDQFNLPDLDQADFSTTNALDSGILRLAWISPDLNNGSSVANGTKIFRLRLQAIGPNNKGTPVYFTEHLPLTSFEIIQATAGGNTKEYKMKDCSLTNGFIAIGYTVDADEPAGENALKASLSPNPFSEKTFLQYELQEITDTQIIVTDATGKIVFEKTQKNLPSGRYGIEIASPQLHEKGWYLLRLQAGDKHFVRPLVRQ